MTALPDINSLAGNVTTNSGFQAGITALYNVISEMAGQGDAEVTVINANSVTPSKALILLETASGATDSLNTILPTNIGAKLLVVGVASTGRTITLINDSGASGSLILAEGENVVLDSKFKYITFRYDTGATKWTEISRSWVDVSIADKSVTNAKLADMGANTVKVRNDEASGVPVDLAPPASTVLARLASGNIVAATVSQIKSLLGLGTAAEATIGTGATQVPTNNMFSDAAKTTIANIRQLPTSVLAANKILALGDANSVVMKNDTTAYTVTVPPNSAVAFVVGTAITLTNGAATANITIARGSGVVFRTMNGNGTDANITLAPWTSVTLLKSATNTWLIQGSGV